MNRLLSCTLLALLCGAAAPVAAVHAAPPVARAYAPDNLRTLSYDDQVRVIGLEYSEQSNGRRIPDDQLRFYIDQVNRSNWTFTRIKQDIAQSLGGGGGPQPPIGSGDTIRCESQNSRPQTCPTPWRGGSRLLRQLSGTACIEGRNWQSQQGRVYVSNGCRAEFASAGQVPPPGSAGSVRCESQDGRARTCPTPWRGRSRLARQLSSTACIEGRNWQSQRGQVFVTNGCRAEFSPSAQGLPWPTPGEGNGNDQLVTCSSTQKQPQSCAWNAGYGRPYVQRQLSTSRCTEHDTWWFEGNAIWVKNGCRAVFGAR